MIGPDVFKRASGAGGIDGGAASLVLVLVLYITPQLIYSGFFFFFLGVSFCTRTTRLTDFEIRKLNLEHSINLIILIF